MSKHICKSCDTVFTPWKDKHGDLEEEVCRFCIFKRQFEPEKEKETK